MRIKIAVLLTCLLSSVAAAKPSRYPPVTQFDGDKYASHAQLVRDVTRAVGCPPPACSRGRAGKAKHLYRVKPRQKGALLPAPRPGMVDPQTNIFRGFVETLRDAGPSKSLAGVVAPLAAKAREIQAACGSRIISAIRHTYIAGTGGRLSLHASGRAVDVAGNPACIYRELRGWPGGYSTDYAAVRHTHISWNPGGAEWGRTFRHYRGGKRRHARRRV